MISTFFDIFSAFSVNLATSTFGLFEGWINTNIILLQSDDTPLPTGKISMEAASWLASIQCIGALAGNICFGWIINRYGRRLPLIIIAVPLVVSKVYHNDNRTKSKVEFYQIHN